MPDSLTSPAAPGPPMTAAMNTAPITDHTAANGCGRHDVPLLEFDEVDPNFDLESLTETLAEPERNSDGQPVDTFIPSVLGSRADPVNPSGTLMAWILLVTFAGLAGPVWAATRVAMNLEEDLVSQRFLACLALNVVFSLVPPFDIQRGKRKVTYSFGEVATLISIAIASAPVAIVAGFVALTIRSVQ